MRTRRTNRSVRVLVGERNPKLFLVPKRAADSVVELLRPYAEEANATIPADEVFAELYARDSKAGTVLQGLRSRESMTQQQLAKKLGVSQGDISAMEHARRPIGKKMASRLAKVFGSDYRVFL